MAKKGDPNQKRDKLFKHLKENKMTPLGYDEFSEKYASGEKFDELYSYLDKEGMTPLSKDEFSKEYFGDVKKKEATPSAPLVTTGESNGEKYEPVSNASNARQVPLEKLKKDLEFYRGFYGEDLGNPGKNEQYNELVDVYQERLKNTPITEAPVAEKVQFYRQNAFLETVEDYKAQGLISEDVANKASKDPEAVYDAMLKAKKDEITKGKKPVSERGSDKTLSDEAPESIEESGEPLTDEDESVLPEFIQDPSARQDETEVTLKPDALTDKDVEVMEKRAYPDAKKDLEKNISSRITKKIEDDLPETMSKEDYEGIEEKLKEQGLRVDLSGEGVIGEDVGFATSALNTFNKSIENIALSAANYAMDMVGQDTKGFDVFRKQRLEKYEENINEYEKTASDALMEGNIGAAMENSLLTLTESAPLMLAAAGSGLLTKNPNAAIATMSALSAAQTYSDVENEEWYKDMSALGKTSYLFTQGTAEGYGEMVSARIFSKAFKNAVASGAGAKGIKKTFRPFLENTAKSMGVSSSEEALAEMATGGIQYVNEKIAKAEPLDVNEFVSTIQESAVQGMVGGAALGGSASIPQGSKILASKGVNTAIAATKTLKAKKADYEIDKTLKSIRKAETPDEREILQERAVRQISNRISISKNERKRINEMPEGQRQEYLDALFSIERLSRKLRKVDPESEAGKVVLEDMKPHEETLERIDEEMFQKSEEQQTQEPIEEEVEEDVAFSEDELSALEEEVDKEDEQGAVSDNLNEKVYRDGKEGMLKIDDENQNTVVFETNDEIIDIGRLDDIGGSSISSFNLSLMPPEGVDVTKQGSDADVVTLDGVDYTIIGRRRDKKGKSVVRVKEVETGLERRLKGEKAERILKDQELKKQKQEPELQLKEEGKPKKKRKEQSIEKKEVDSMSEAEFEEAQAKAEEEVNKFEEELTDEAVKQGSVNRLIFPVGENKYAVKKKKDGTYTVSQENENGKYVGIKDKDARETAINEYERLKEQKEGEALKQAEDLAKEFREEQEDKVLSLLDDLIEKTSNQGRAFDASLGIPLFVANSSLKVVKAAYKAGKSLAEAIKDGISYLKDQGYNVNETEYKKFILSESKKQKKDGKEKDTEEQQSMLEGVQTRGDETQERQEGSELRTEKQEEQVDPVLSKLKTVAQAYKKGKNDTKKEMTGFAKEVDKALKNFKKGVVSAAKARTIANKAANIKSEKQLDNFISYAKKVLEKASYEQDLKVVKQKQKRAETRRKKGDLGTDAGQTRDALKIKPQNLDIDDLDRYNSMVQTMSKPGYKRKDVAKDISYFAKMYRGEAKEKAESQKNKTKKPKKDTPLAKKTREEILSKQKDKKIDFNYKYEEEYDVLMSMTEQELKELNDNELQEVSQAIDNIEEGFDPSHKAAEITTNIQAERKEDVFKEATNNKVFNGLLRSVIPRLLKRDQKAGTKDRMITYIRKIPLNRIDTIFKGKKGNQIYKEFIRPISSAYSSFKGAINSIELDYGKLYNKIKDKKNYDIKASLIALAKQKEFNPENPELGSVEDYMQAIDEAGLRNNDYRPLAREYRLVYNSLLEKDGGFDWRKQYDNLSLPEKRAFDFAEETFADNAEMVRAGATRNGDPTVVYEYYSPLRVMFEMDTKLDDITKQAESFSEGRPVSIAKAQNFKERTKGAKPIYLSFSENFLRSSRQTLQDYHLRRPMRVFAKTIGKINKNEDIDATGRDFAQAIDAVMKEVTRNVFINNNYELDDGSFAKISNYLVKRGYQGALASVPRMGAEFSSNALYAFTYAPKDFSKGAYLITGSKLDGDDFSKFRELTRLAQSTQYTRLWQQEGGMLEEQGTSSGTTPFAGKRLKQLDKGIDRINNAVVSAPDRAIAIPMWTGTFARNFEKKAGVKLDVDKFNKDASYREKHRTAIDAATMEADRKLSQGFATMNPFESIVSSQVTKTDKWYQIFDKFMTRFIRFEYQSLVDSFYGAVGQNELTRGEAGALAFSTLTRMAAYNMMYDKLSSVFYPAVEGAIALVTGQEDLGPREEDDEEEWSSETITEDIMRGYFGGALSLVLGRRMGNIGRIAPNFAIEYFNREYGEKLGFRDGEYDPYKNSLVFSTIKLQAEGERYNENKLGEDILTRVSGPYSKIIKTAIRGAKRTNAAINNKTEEGRERAANEVYNRIIPEMILFGLGAPLSKDIDRLLLREVFEEYNEKEKKKKSEGRGGVR